MRRRRKKKNYGIALNKIDFMLDRLKNKDNDFFDGIHPFRTGTRTLSVKNNKALFKKCVEMDFDYLMSRKFAVDKNVLERLLIQSVLGRAFYGHGWFVDDEGFSLKFSDVTFDGICTVLEERYPTLNNIDVRRFRSLLVEEFISYILDSLDKEELIFTAQNRQFFGIDFLKEFEPVKTKDFLKGVVIAGLMDDYTFRRKTLFAQINDFDGYPLELGSGEVYIVDRKKFEQLGLKNTGENEFSKHQIDYLTDIGVIVNSDEFYDYPKYDSVYFRRRVGEGVSDDLAMIYIGKRYGVDAMLGALLIDAVDTYDKFLIKFRNTGMDGYLANITLQHLDYDFVSMEEIMQCIYFAAKMNTPSLRLSSSHRRFVQVENRANKPTFLMHFDFLRGQEMPEFKLGYVRMKSKDFYEIASNRLENLNKL